jgi:hypothetical protein
LVPVFSKLRKQTFVLVSFIKLVSKNVWLQFFKNFQNERTSVSGFLKIFRIKEPLDLVFSGAFKELTVDEKLLILRFFENSAYVSKLVL